MRLTNRNLNFTTFFILYSITFTIFMMTVNVNRLFASSDMEVIEEIIENNFIDEKYIDLLYLQENDYIFQTNSCSNVNQDIKAIDLENLISSLEKYRRSYKPSNTEKKPQEMLRNNDILELEKKNLRVSVVISCLKNISKNKQKRMFWESLGKKKLLAKYIFRIKKLNSFQLLLIQEVEEIGLFNIFNYIYPSKSEKLVKLRVGIFNRFSNELKKNHQLLNIFLQINNPYSLKKLISFKVDDSNILSTFILFLLIDNKDKFKLFKLIHSSGKINDYDLIINFFKNLSYLSRKMDLKVELFCKVLKKIKHRSKDSYRNFIEILNKFALIKELNPLKVFHNLVLKTNFLNFSFTSPQNELISLKKLLEISMFFSNKNDYILFQHIYKLLKLKDDLFLTSFYEKIDFIKYLTSIFPNNLNDVQLNIIKKSFLKKVDPLNTTLFINTLLKSGSEIILLSNLSCIWDKNQYGILKHYVSKKLYLPTDSKINYMKLIKFLDKFTADDLNILIFFEKIDAIDTIGEIDHLNFYKFRISYKNKKLIHNIFKYRKNHLLIKNVINFAVSEKNIIFLNELITKYPEYLKDEKQVEVLMSLPTIDVLNVFIKEYQENVSKDDFIINRDLLILVKNVNAIENLPFLIKMFNQLKDFKLPFFKNDLLVFSKFLGNKYQLETLKNWSKLLLNEESGEVEEIKKEICLAQLAAVFTEDDMLESSKNPFGDLKILSNMESQENEEDIDIEIFKFPGLKNRGNTCFQNSVFFFLATIKGIMNVLDPKKHQLFKEMDEIDSDIHFHYRKARQVLLYYIVKSIREFKDHHDNNKVNRLIDIFNNIFEASKSSEFNGQRITYNQMCAREFLFDLLDSIQYENSPYKIMKNRTIKHFIGPFPPNCENKELVETIWPIPSKDIRSLQAYFEEQFKVKEVFRNNERFPDWKICDQDVLRMQQLPNVLILYIERGKRRNNYRQGGFMNYFRNPNDKSTEKINFDIVKLIDINEEWAYYAPISFVVHLGTLNSGHYYLCAKDISSNKYIELNDNIVETIYKENFLRTTSKNTTIVYYRKITNEEAIRKIEHQKLLKQQRQLEQAEDHRFIEDTLSRSEKEVKKKRYDYNLRPNTELEDFCNLQ